MKLYLKRWKAKKSLRVLKPIEDPEYKCKVIIVATGTFLKGRIIIGDVSYSGGPDGLFPANKLGQS